MDNMERLDNPLDFYGIYGLGRYCCFYLRRYEWILLVFHCHHRYMEDYGD